MNKSVGKCFCHPFFSPFNIAVQPGSAADKVKVTGDGVKPTVLASMPVQFTIDTREAKKPADVDVVIQVWVTL